MTEIQIEEKLLISPKLLNLCRSHANRWVILTDDTTRSLYGEKVHHFLTDHHIKAHLLSFPSGEAHKSRSSKEKVEDQMLALGCGRDTGMITLGGGIVTDLGGFVASTYCRGIPLIHLPTTLLGMVDASIGGKTGVNVSAGKNMIGTIYQPLAILMDLSVLKTLPRKELQNGIVECIKHGAILSAPYFDFLETDLDAILKLEGISLKKTVEDSCQIKLRVVKEDEREVGLRRLLNFGHTIGHALETLTHHQIPHGQAVAIGMVGEAFLSKQLGVLGEADFDRLQAIIQRYGVDLRLKAPLSPAQFLQTMQLDKKALKQTPRFVILKGIGECLPCNGEYCQSVDPQILEEVLAWLCASLYLERL